MDYLCYFCLLGTGFGTIHTKLSYPNGSPMLSCTYEGSGDAVTWWRVRNTSQVFVASASPNETQAISGVALSFRQKPASTHAGYTTPPQIVTSITQRPELAATGDYFCDFGNEKHILWIPMNVTIELRATEDRGWSLECQGQLVCPAVTVQWYANSTYLGSTHSDGRPTTRPAGHNISHYNLSMRGSVGHLQLWQHHGLFSCVFVSCDAHGIAAVSVAPPPPSPPSLPPSPRPPTAGDDRPPRDGSSSGFVLAGFLTTATVIAIAVSVLSVYARRRWRPAAGCCCVD
ncbi:t121.4 [Tupaiid betaherpesvirus 1]|uniref:T121.4 n=1 Tax=Tupaiid herpesvirus 1 (strain 1) TaxID=10397 RepID=Q91TH6_TUHV1|nr:t121.4 [Tupaiid betaherpesvirus 1]AAK57171.1 t121.4 [Tupaiid betaherpesvirus 1]